MALTDTHTIIKDLITAGIPEKQAEVLVSRFVVKEALDSIEQDHSKLATKGDILSLQHKIEVMEQKLESKIVTLDTNIKWLTAITLLVAGILIKNTFF